VGVGIFVRVDGTINTLQSGCNSSYIHLHTAAYILIGVGAAVMILGFLGCCGAMRESQCLLVLV
jgi:CD9 antigen